MTVFEGEALLLGVKVIQLLKKWEQEAAQVDNSRTQTDLDKTSTESNNSLGNKDHE